MRDEGDMIAGPPQRSLWWRNLCYAAVAFIIVDVLLTAAIVLTP